MNDTTVAPTPIATVLFAGIVAVLSVGVSAAAAFAVAGHSAPLWGVPVPYVLLVLCFAMNWIAFVPAALQKSERFYDATGSLTFLLVVAVALAASAQAGTLSFWRVAPAVLVVVWTLRLGSFLVARIRREGRDRRFDALKQTPARFFIPWTLQGLWVFLTALAAVVQVTSTEPPASSPVMGIVGLCVWLFGFVVEVVADRQKRAFSLDPRNNGPDGKRFITTGLWAWSRHPNYFGEMTLWFGVFLMGVQGYVGGQWVAALSPLFVVVLLWRVSGIPLLEERAEARWGKDPAWIAWRDKTPMLLPRPPRR